MRLLVVGQYSDTGFGTVTKELSIRFLQAGHDVRVIAENHRGEPIEGPLAGRIWPDEMPRLPFGAGIVTAGIGGQLWKVLNGRDDWKPEAVLVIADVSGLLGRIGTVTKAVVELWMSVPVYHYCPIEGDNLPMHWREVWEMVKPVAMSDYGQRVISEHIGRPVPRIYHGVNVDQFRPITFRDPATFTNPQTGEVRTVATQEAAKAIFGLEGKKVILRADRNATRKFYYRMLEAFVPIAEAEPDAVLLLHCQAIEPDADLIGEVRKLPEAIREGGRIWFTGMHDTFRGLDIDSLRVLYNAGDVYLSTTGGEGFGLTLAESLACGTPVVVTDWAAEREVVGPGGILVDPLRDEYGEVVRFHSTYGMDWALPDPKKYVEPTLRLLRKPSERRSLAEAGRRHVARSFNWDTVSAQFLSLFEEAHAVAA